MLKKEIHLRLPDSWEALTDREALELYSLLASGLPNTDLPMLAMVRLNAIRVIARQGNGSGYLCRSRFDSGIWSATPATLAGLAAQLDWIVQLPSRPWRPEKGWPAGARPLSPMLDELTFADWLIIQNTLHAVAATDDFSPLDRLLPMLTRAGRRWPAIGGRSMEPEACRVAIFRWMMGLRMEFGRRYRHLYPPASEEDDQPARITPQMLAESTDAQLRALTGGDVTKEEQVMALPIARALAELNAKAREYAELKSKQK